MVLFTVIPEKWRFMAFFTATAYNMVVYGVVHSHC
jgi:hypothetical protein